MEGEARLEFVRDDKKGNMQFLDADVERPFPSMIAIVNKGNIVAFAPQESYMETTSIGQRIPMNRRQGVFAVQLDARAGTRSPKMEKFVEPNTNERMPVSKRPA